ncbi:OLC1v1028148C1 [Oldenlandia corymbosa var. corymbosa]|uniref:OLC1v1028148C1 n=1 Tax=Oldenlandia corymbosa var. corymbosa TaxID=529605 RepID=A0AAV1CBU0_OLDCO|nr:OLC1v1028148C1 [Oldenlandia corymbosa var. corymbosa]
MKTMFWTALKRPRRIVCIPGKMVHFECILEVIDKFFTYRLKLGLIFGVGVGDAFKVPFRVKDVLPVLPRQISWPVMNNLHSAVDLLPSYIGSLTPHNGSIDWKGACFLDNSGRVELTAAGDRGIGGAVIYLSTSAAHSWTCMDLYVFATPYRVTWDYYFSARDHTLRIESWEEPAEEEYVRQHGISVFLMPSGMLGTLLSMVDVLPLFSNTAWGQKANLEFLKKHMGATFETRPQPWITTINPVDVHSGDFLALSKIRGRWGGFETLEKWVTGAFAGHTAVCLKDELGDLWVAESGYENEKGEEIIAVVPWDEWWESALKDESNPQIALLPLHPDIRARFNSSAAWDYVQRMSGKPYGYHNMIFSWIDTVTDNFPPPLDAHLVISLMSMWTRVQPSYAANMWNEALNKRLETEGLDLYEILTETEKRGLTFDQLLTIPEQDEWIYSDGKSTTCVAFILAMYKEAGVFGHVAESIQVTEFTIRDAYMLKIFENNKTRLPNWCNNEDENLPFCQILGEYRMELPHYNTLEPYAHMNENCPSLPPTYERPNGC